MIKKKVERRKRRKKERKTNTICVSNGLCEDLGDNNGKIDYKC